jgi:hypothetical protein
VFSDRSILTMVHGIVLSGAALMAMAALLFHLYVARTAPSSAVASPAASWLGVLVAVTLWLVVLGGSYIIFPLYRATPPEGGTDLAAYPRALILADPSYSWLHSFAMEIKEHVPWIAAMLATSVAAVGVRYKARLVTDASLRGMSMTLLAIVFALVSVAGLLGTLINKFAPLE